MKLHSVSSFEAVIKSTELIPLCSAQPIAMFWNLFYFKAICLNKFCIFDRFSLNFCVNGAVPKMLTAEKLKIFLVAEFLIKGFMWISFFVVSIVTKSNAISEPSVWYITPVSLNVQSYFTYSSCEQLSHWIYCNNCNNCKCQTHFLIVFQFRLVRGLDSERVMCGFNETPDVFEHKFEF